MSDPTNLLALIPNATWEKFGGGVHGRNFVPESGGDDSRILAARCKNCCIAPFFAQCLPRHATSKLGLSKKSKSGSKSGVDKT